MRLVARRSLCLLSALAAVAMVSCVSVKEPVVSKLAPDNAVFDLEKEGLRRVWSQELGQLTQSRRLKDIYSAGRYVVVEAQKGEVHCLDAATGVWQATGVLKAELRIPPTAVGTKLAFVVKNDVVMYDVATGRAEKPRMMNFPLTARPLLHGDSLFLGGGDGKVERLQLAEQAAKWLASLRGPITEQPVVAGNCLLATAPTGILMWDLVARKESARWEPNPPARITSGAAAVGERVYVGDSRGVLYSLDADTGDVTWERMMGGPVTGKLTVAGPNLLVLTSKPSLICLDAAGERAEHWRLDGVVGVLAVGKVAVYVRKADGTVAALSMETGKEMWSDPLPADCKVVGDDNSPTFYIANPRGSVVAFTEMD